MFTRYSDIEIPENYGGNRFGRAKSEDTTTKMHIMQPQSTASSITLSPSFSEKIYSSSKLKSDTPPEIAKDASSDEYIDGEEIKSTVQKSESPEDKDTINTKNTANGDISESDEISNSKESESLDRTDRESAETVSPVLSHETDKSKSTFANSGLSKITEMLEKSSPEDLLLVMLIILLASDTENKNDDIALTLALLLLSDKQKPQKISGEC